MFNNVPHEMKMYQQWVMWRFEDTNASKPTKVPYSALTGRHANVNDPQTWTTFDNALHTMQTGLYAGIGFVLTERDPFAFIDLDDTHGDEIGFKRQQRIFNEFDSYSELSPSGSGLHIIVKGSIPSGRKRSQIEVYSAGRYMTMTGNVYRNAPVNDCNDLLNLLHSQLSKGPEASLYYAGLTEAKHSNEYILDIAQKAANGEKFYDLYYMGDWQKYYPSQSEADLALIDIIAFYSENRYQVQELFLESALGQREKSRAQYRINYMLAKCFDRMLPPVDIDGLRDQLNEVVERKQKELAAAAASNNPTPQKSPVSRGPDLSKVYTVPEGLVGDIAKFIYAQAPYAVPEIALAGALGLMAGIVGRAYNVDGTGLNQYIMLLAPTGTGKESMNQGINKILGAVMQSVPTAGEFLGPSAIASEQALIKYISNQAASFVSIAGEFGITLQQMSAYNAPPHLVGIRRIMLALYNSSGNTDTLQPTIYSDKDKNTAILHAPAFTLLGESTPEKYYEGLHEGLITEGLLPRFTVIEYNGKRPYMNKKFKHVVPDANLINKVADLCTNAQRLNSQNKVVSVRFDEQAQRMFDEFCTYCTDQCNGSEVREVTRSLWTRTHMKAIKLAALIAVGNNQYDPLITHNVGTWAINVILADVNNLLGRFNAGEIGIDNDESQQLVKTIDVIKDFITSPWSDLSSYLADGMSALHSQRIVPYSYIQRRLGAVSVFKRDRIGATNAIKRALKTMCERGDIQEVGRATLAKDYNTSAVCYAITNLKTLGL